MSSSVQDSTPSRAGCRPRWSWEPTYTFLGLALPQHLNQMRAPKRNQPSLFQKALLGRRCLFTSLGQCSKHESVTPPSPMLSHRQRLGKRGRATCRETCTCGSGRAFLRYLITLLLLAAGAPLLTIAHLFRNNLFRRDNFTYFCQILLLLSTAGTISMCFDSSEQERFDAFEFIVLIPLPTRSMLFMISAHDSIAMYLAIEPQSLCFYVMAASKRKSEFSTEAGSKYLILGAFSSGILLFGYDRTTTDI